MMQGMAGHLRTMDGSGFDSAALAEAKSGRTVSVLIPARNEERTIGAVVDAVRAPHVLSANGTGLVDEVVVIDDGSSDATAAVASSRGAQVLALEPGGGGKGQAMRAGLDACSGDLVVFLDADVENTSAAFVAGLLAPLVLYDDVALVKGFYERPLHGAPGGGGRVTELVARPLIDVCFPELAGVRQPLAGETAAPRWVLEKVGFADGYGVELGLLVDVTRRFGVGSLAQVDLGIRVHRNRPLDELRPQAADVIRAALERLEPGRWP
jgi:glucosyl-3-phosphoglycerate synthase